MKDLTAKLIAFRDARKWGKFHTEAELARSLTIEATELNRLYQWGKTPDTIPLAEEIADVMIYCLYLCEARDLDPEEIIHAKIGKNALKYPAGQDHATANGWHP
jgi:dCTP diphosphatase